MFEEIAPYIIEALIDNENSLTIDSIVKITDYDKPIVNRTVRILGELGILISKDNLLSLNKNLKAIHIARVAQLGVDLTQFNGFFKIDKKEKTTAIEIAASVDKIKNLDLKGRKPLVQNRLFFTVKNSDEVTAILINLLEASNHTLYEYLNKLSQKDKHLKSLMDLHSSAEKSLSDYLKDK